MGVNNQFDWVDFYKELADKLLYYKLDRDALIKKVLEIYKNADISMPKLEKDNKLVDIDPFTFFGLFNKKITDENRIKLLKAIAELFQIKAPIPKSFASLPVLSPQNATFYYFIPDRGEDDIQDLWELFDYALSYTKSRDNKTLQSLSSYFDLNIQKKGNGNSKITMGLYWIAPDTFLNLDQRNVWYIYDSGKFPEDFVKTLPSVESKMSSSDYFTITNKLRSFLNSEKSNSRISKN